MRFEVTKWHLNKEKHYPQSGVSHCVIEGSDLCGAVTAYMTKHGNISVLKYNQNKDEYAFYPISDLLEVYGKGSGHFASKHCTHDAIENALIAGRHVYSFADANHMIKNKGKFIRNTANYYVPGIKIKRNKFK